MGKRASVGLGLLIRDAQPDSNVRTGGFIWDSMVSELNPASAIEIDAAVERSANSDTLGVIRRFRTKLPKDVYDFVDAGARKGVAETAGPDKDLSNAILMLECSICLLPALGGDTARPIQFVLDCLTRLGSIGDVKNMSSDQAKAISTAIAALPPKLCRREVLETRLSSIHGILQQLIVVDRLLASSGFQNDANNVIGEACTLQRLLVQNPSNDHAIGDQISLVLACRWPSDRLKQAEQLLAEAEAIADAEQNVRRRYGSDAPSPEAMVESAVSMLRVSFVKVELTAGSFLLQHRFSQAITSPGDL